MTLDRLHETQGSVVMNGELHEIKSWLILEPGPAALTDGLDALRSIVASWRSASGSASLLTAAS